jgi:ABC-type transporter Mla MlaB component
MTPFDFAFPVRPGEHACCRSDDPQDCARLLAAFVYAGLARRHKVLHVCDECEHDEVLARLCADAAVGEAHARGQFEVRAAAGWFAAGGPFDVDRTVQAVRDEHDRALARGYTGLSVCGDVGTGLSGVPGERVAEYERRLDAELAGATRVFLCQYGHRALDDRTLSEVTAAHHVVVSAELAAIGRTGVLAAARVTSPETLRLAGELDFEAAHGVAGVLQTEFGGRRCIDAADLQYVDVAGMRALRGAENEPLTISGASEPVRRLVALLGWDTDPSVEVVA